MSAEAAARRHAFADAAFALHRAGIEISARHVQRSAAARGAELAPARDHPAAPQRRRELPARVAAPPEVVAVAVEGGRRRTRAGHGGPGVHPPQNQEDQIACLVSRHRAVPEPDRPPEPSPSFREPWRVPRLVPPMPGWSRDQPPAAAGPEAPSPAEPPPAAPHERPPSPPRRVRTCVASMVDRPSFGPMVAAEAQERAGDRVPRRAVLADGAADHGWMPRAYGAAGEPSHDLLHVRGSLSLAAWGGALTTSSDGRSTWAGGGRAGRGVGGR